MLETIVGRIHTLQHLLMMLQRNAVEDDFSREICVDAAEILATGIGALADAAVGSNIFGDHDRWNYGPNFKHAGRAEASEETAHG